MRLKVTDAFALLVGCSEEPLLGQRSGTRASRTSDSDRMVRVSSPCSARW